MGFFNYQKIIIKYIESDRQVWDSILIEDTIDMGPVRLENARDGEEWDQTPTGTELPVGANFAKPFHKLSVAP